MYVEVDLCVLHKINSGPQDTETEDFDMKKKIVLEKDLINN